MSRRNSPNDIADLGELSLLADFVVDKCQGQGASAQKHRRNRHYEKQFTRNTMAHPLQSGGAEPDEQGLSLSHAGPSRQQERS